MENRVIPIISVSRASTPGNDYQCPNSEPEMEDNREVVLRELIQELGINENDINESDLLNHNPNEQEACFHCIMTQKISSLKSDINKMSSDIIQTSEILKIKKGQNTDLKEMIEKLEESYNLYGKNENERKGVNCSCTGKCMAF